MFSELNPRVPGHHDNEQRLNAMQLENLDSVHRRNFDVSVNCGSKDSSSSSLGSSVEFVHGRTSQFDRFSKNSTEKSEVNSSWRSHSSHSQRSLFDTRKSSDVYLRSKSQDGPEFRRLHGANENSGKSRFSGNSFNVPQSSHVQQGGFDMKKSSNDLSSGYNRSLSVGQFPSHRHFEKQADFADEICLAPPNSLDATLIPMTNNSGFASNVQDSFQVNHCARNSVDSFEGLDSRLSIESLNSASDLGTPFLDQSSVGLPHDKDDIAQNLLDSEMQTGSKPSENLILGNFFAGANSTREKQTHDRLDRRKSENLDFKKSISHNTDGRSNHSRHGIHHYGSSRHRDRNRESSRRRNRRRKHRSKYHSSKSGELEKSNQGDQLIMATANSEGIAVEEAEKFGSSLDAELEDPDAELRASLESRIQALLDQSEENAARNLQNGVRFPPPPLPPELPPPPPPLPPVEMEQPPLPPEPEPMDGHGWLSMSRIHDGVEMGDTVFCNFGEATSDSLTSQQIARLRTSVRGDMNDLYLFF